MLSYKIVFLVYFLLDIFFYLLIRFQKLLHEINLFSFFISFDSYLIYVIAYNFKRIIIFFQMLHKGFFDWSNHFTLHLSTRYMDQSDRNRTILQFAVLNTSYGEVARHVLWGNPEQKDISPWILHPHPC